MSKFINRTLLVIFFVFTVSSIGAQPFANEIQAFKKQDSISSPAKNAILFTGSSSFTMWKDVQQYFPGYTIINRGFGGSALPDLISYADDVIFRYRPKQIVIYCGENDIASSDTVTAPMVLERFTELFNMIRKKMPSVPIAFISLKPSPSRWQMMERMTKTNRLISQYIKGQTDAVFINVWDAMIGADALPKQEIFIADNLHMNAKGYAIWQKLIEPYLAK